MTAAAPAEPLPTSLSSQLLSTIQDRIVSGEIPPGTRLVERALCEEFAVSRSVVREAIVRLANSGLVSITPDAGATVSALTDSGAPAPVTIIGVGANARYSSLR